MAALVEQGMREGAVGLSSGLEYDVGSYSATEELVELSRAAARHGGFYMTHMRDEADKSFEAFAEADRDRRAGRSPSRSPTSSWARSASGKRRPKGRSRSSEGARRRGVDVTADCYPYKAWHSNMEVLVPNKQYDDPASVDEALADVGGAATSRSPQCQAHPDYGKRTLEEIARTQGITPVELYIRMVKDGGADIIGHSMTEEDVEAFSASPGSWSRATGASTTTTPRAPGPSRGCSAATSARGAASRCPRPSAR